MPGKKSVWMELLTLLGTLALIVAIALGGWKLSRWLNWRLSYGPKVEERLAKIETRLDALETRELSEGQE